ncbi:MAG: alpha-galactosidase [Candidatus Hydrogenedentes bacterium]|nr:alpha-galactosidase [Candidatus Hydrogenedentota bacterium]
MNDIGEEESWQIVLPRDSVQKRLAIIDLDGDVQGYVVFTGSGDALKIGVIHRAARNYEGGLTLDATVRLGKQAFACPPQHGRWSECMRTTDYAR